MFVRMLTVHCVQNHSYEITMNGLQVRQINEIRNVIFGLRKPSSALRPSWDLHQVEYFHQVLNLVFVKNWRPP